MELTRLLVLIDDAIKNNVSDIHFSTGEFPYIRNKIGEMTPVENFGKLNEEDIKRLISIMLGREFTEKTVDISYERSPARFRVNISRVIHGISIAMRMIPSAIPEPETIDLTPALLKLGETEKGIILVTGPTGSGKSTTLATMVEYLNRREKRHVMTLEDPIEFVYSNKECLIHQRELGVHFDSFPVGIRSILREDPDVIIVGEMRDLETIRAAITLAETGHLVLSTLHTNDTVQTIDRIIQSFPPDEQNQIRMQLSLALTGVISQVLLPKEDESGRIVAREVMLNTDSIRNLIIRGQTHQMYSVLETSSQHGMNLMDDALISLYKKKLISRDSVVRHIKDLERLKMITGEKI